METITRETVAGTAEGLTRPSAKRVVKRARRRASDTSVGELRAMLERRLAAVTADTTAVPAGGTGDDSYMAHCRTAAARGGDGR